MQIRPLFSALLLGCFSVNVAMASSSELAKLDRLIAQQLQVEQATANLQLEAQQSLADNERLLALYQQEHKALTQAVAKQQQQQDEVTKQRNDLLQAQTQQEQRSAQVQQQLQQGTELLQVLWPQLPEPLQQQLQMAQTQMHQPHLGLSERFAAMINMLTQLEEFNRTISLHRGVLNHNGTPWQAEQLFIGLAQGYYRLPNAQGMGVGQVIDGQWQWRALPMANAEIERAFAIYQNQHPVAFVSLPLSVLAQEQP